jgi:hypothetical protein
MTRFLEPKMTFRVADIDPSITYPTARCPIFAHLGWKHKLVGGEWRCECGERLVPVNG